MARTSLVYRSAAWSLRATARVSFWCAAIFAIATCSDGGLPTDVTPDGALGPGTAGRWITSAPRDQDVDPNVLQEIESRIDAGEFGAISSLLVLRRGVLVYERYADDWTPEDLHRVYSVTKSVTSLLMGIAIAEGLVAGVAGPVLERPVLELLPAYDVQQNPSPGKSDLTLEHVLQMRAGFEWDELATNYSSGINPTAALVASPDWIQHVLDLPLVAQPGSTFVYNSGVSMLMAGVLEAATGESAEVLGADRLFGPLAIDDWIWSEGPGGLTNSGWGLRMRPRDMAAIGQLVLQEGSWEGNQVVPAAWIEASATQSTTFTDGNGYGYQWWLESIGSGFTPTSSSLGAWGWGGQFIVVLPSVEMVLISTAENYESGGFDPSVLAAFGYRAAGETGSP